MVLTTKNKEAKHHIHHKHKIETEKTALANRTNYTLIWYAFYDLTAPEPTHGWFDAEDLAVIPDIKKL